MFCAAVMPNADVGLRAFGFRSFGFRILYRAYGSCVVNTFILCSTWMTVAMAVSRYVAICYPLHARQLIGRSFASSTIGGVFVASIVANVPRYFRSQIVSIECIEGGEFYFLESGWLSKHQSLELAYQWTYFIVGILLPFVVLVFCNVNFVAALRRSLRLRNETTMPRVRCTNRAETGSGCSGGAGDSATANRITLTLVIIVAMYFALVMPSEVLIFLGQVVVTKPTEYLGPYHLVLAIFNALQAINFAFNFLLYCAVNTHFRQTVLRLVYHVFCCRSRLDQITAAAASGDRRRSNVTLMTCSAAVYRKESQCAAMCADRLLHDDDRFASTPSMTAYTASSSPGSSRVSASSMTAAAAARGPMKQQRRGFVGISPTASTAPTVVVGGYEMKKMHGKMTSDPEIDARLCVSNEKYENERDARN
jgi:hypothetical protein